MRNFDFSPLYRASVGFDQLQSLLDNATREAQTSTYPPYNIERVDEHNYRISMAVAGFAEDDLEIEVKQNVLTVKGQKTEPEEQTNYLYQGIAARSFERRFQLADHVEVTGARLENGLLHVELQRQIPEEMKPRRIAIANAGQGQKALEGSYATAAD